MIRSIAAILGEGPAGMIYRLRRIAILVTVGLGLILVYHTREPIPAHEEVPQRKDFCWIEVVLKLVYNVAV
jgi:hypothetical protein